VTQVQKTDASPESLLDIIVFVAHLDLATVELEGLVGRMVGELEWPTRSSHIRLVVPDDSEFGAAAGVPVTVLNSSAAASAFRERCCVLEAAPHDVLISFGPYLPGCETIERLRFAARNDEMVSAVAPRIAIGTKNDLMALGPRSGSNAIGLIDSKYRPKLSAAYFLPEILCPCMLVPARMSGNVDIPENFDHFPDLLLAFLRAGRRRGLLVRIDNQCVLAGDGTFDAVALQRQTADMLQLFDDYEPAARRLAASPAFTDERRFQLLRRSSPAVSGSLLYDCTNIPPTFSGSADHMLGVLKGASGIERGAWDFTVMVADETRKSFSLDERFPGIRFTSKSDDSYYDCAIRSTQPWSIAELADLNRRARSIAATIHDTIGPDVIYAVAEEAEEAFQFAAEYADGLIYISEFTGAQFARRFMRRPALAESVIYSSLDPTEYAADSGVTGSEWILIFGNAYDHKDLERTSKIVSAAFPYEKIKLVGNKDLSGSNVDAFDSGALENAVVEDLFRRAKCVVFPSFYEGFGLPLLKGLAYGKAVIARRSRVFREIVARFPGKGGLIEFENSLELVPAIGRVLHGRDVAALSPISGTSHGACHDWKACAAQIFSFAEQMRKSEDVEVWRKRDRALRYVASSR